MNLIRYSRRISILIFLFLSIGVFGQNSLNELYVSAIEALKNEDYQSYLSLCLEMNEIRPNHPEITRHLAQAYLYNNQVDNSAWSIRNYFKLNADTSILNTPPFITLMNPVMKSTLLEVASNILKPVSNAEMFVTMEDNLLHPEGIGFDPVNQHFYVSGFRQRKILKINENGEVSDFMAYPEFPFGAVSGIAVWHDKLWVTTVAAPQMKNFDPIMEGSSKVIKIDISRRQIESVYEVEDENSHWFGDLIVDQDGNVLVSDSQYPMIYRIKNGSDKILPFYTNPDFLSLQGIAMDADKRELYIADYVTGIYKLDIATESLISRHVEFEDFALKGTDGLYYKNGNLIAIQNGIYPKRIIKIHLDETGSKIISIQPLENANPELQEPTLGVLVEDYLYFVGNSPWPFYDQHQKLDSSKVKNPKIYKVRITD